MSEVVAPDGLRERKKRATRRALHDAAMRLVLERGLEHVTVEEISAAADVSVRTFFNYFPTKEKAVLGDPIVVDEEYATATLAAADTLLAGLHDVVLAITADTAADREQVLRRWELMERYPALLPLMFAHIAEFEGVLTRAVAARTGDRPDGAYPQLMASIAGTAIRVALRRWTAGHGDKPLDSHINEVFGLLSQQQMPGESPQTRGGTS
jgi:AcrR family transcriptional regulator